MNDMSQTLRPIENVGHIFIIRNLSDNDTGNGDGSGHINSGILVLGVILGVVFWFFCEAGSALYCLQRMERRHRLADYPQEPESDDDDDEENSIISSSEGERRRVRQQQIREQRLREMGIIRHSYRSSSYINSNNKIMTPEDM